MDKQILGEKESFLDEIKNEAELLETLKQFTKTAEEKVNILKLLFADLATNSEDHDLSQIYIEKKVFDPNSCRWINGSAIDNFQKTLYEAMKSDNMALNKD